ncbi:hypothetical protein O2W14_09830 [Modestobacter sp. VKM Ac-2986]|nr:hypothetical protein [Modestobacter sp. VKM Ac-2986]MCZ2829133.1 hypothetical protein [Modestobacter sp. VKM Ac-2986]
MGKLASATVTLRRCQSGAVTVDKSDNRRRSAASLAAVSIIFFVLGIRTT